ncbi:hypothetical protein PVAND_013313 [Polypedilum vanderplanki]|uniref:Uncharacterized protein n=1 Tax=Polypedilum vanderplanki TaxID=319348 RepID=A0A9J6CQ36_POLVA|nr:hypothetical protein PVAND_013313 [Polypedilum vanderplanki]
MTYLIAIVILEGGKFAVGAIDYDDEPLINGEEVRGLVYEYWINQKTALQSMPEKWNDKDHKPKCRVVSCNYRALDYKHRASGFCGIHKAMSSTIASLINGVLCSTERCTKKAGVCFTEALCFSCKALPENQRVKYPFQFSYEKIKKSIIIEMAKSAADKFEVWKKNNPNDGF